MSPRPDSAPALPRLPLMVLVAALFAVGVSSSFVFAILPSAGRDLGLTEVQLGLIVAPAAFVLVLANGFWGAASERLGRKPVILLAVAATGVVTLAFGLIIRARLDQAIPVTTTFFLLMACRMLYGACSGGILPGAQAYVADTTPPALRTRALATIGAGFALGLVAGPAVTAATTSLGVTAPFYVVGAIGVAATLLVLLTLREPPRKKREGRSPGDRTSFADLWALLLIVVLSFSAYGILLQVTGFRMQDQFGLSGLEAARRAGVALMIAAAGLVAVQILMGRTRLSLRLSAKLLVVGSVLMLLAMAALGLFAGFAVQLAAMGLFGVGLGAVLPSGLGLLTVVAEAAGDQGRVAGFSGAAQGLGIVFGPLAGAAAYQQLPASPYLLGGLLLLAAAALAAFAAPRALHRRRPAGSSPD